MHQKAFIFCLFGLFAMSTLVGHSWQPHSNEMSEQAVFNRTNVPRGDVGPEINNVHHDPVQPTPDDVVSVFATVTDPEGLASVEIYYKINESLITNIADMTWDKGDIYTFEFDPMVEGTQVDYLIYAKDVNGNDNEAMDGDSMFSFTYASQSIEIGVELSAPEFISPGNNTEIPANTEFELIVDVLQNLSDGTTTTEDLIYYTYVEGTIDGQFHFSDDLEYNGSAPDGIRTRYRGSINGLRNDTYLQLSFTFEGVYEPYSMNKTTFNNYTVHVVTYPDVITVVDFRTFNFENESIVTPNNPSELFVDIKLQFANGTITTSDLVENPLFNFVIAEGIASVVNLNYEGPTDDQYIRYSVETPQLNNNTEFEFFFIFHSRWSCYLYLVTDHYHLTYRTYSDDVKIAGVLINSPTNNSVVSRDSLISFEINIKYVFNRNGTAYDPGDEYLPWIFYSKFPNMYPSHELAEYNGTTSDGWVKYVLSFLPSATDHELWFKIAFPTPESFILIAPELSDINDKIHLYISEQPIRTFLEEVTLSLANNSMVFPNVETEVVATFDLRDENGSKLIITEDAFNNVMVWVQTPGSWYEWLEFTYIGLDEEENLVYRFTLPPYPNATDLNLTIQFFSMEYPYKVAELKSIDYMLTVNYEAMLTDPKYSSTCECSCEECSTASFDTSFLAFSIGVIGLFSSIRRLKTKKAG